MLICFSWRLVLMAYDLYAEGLSDDLKRFMDADSRTKREITETALWREFGGTRKSSIDIRIEHKDRRIEVLRDEIEDLKQELETEREERELLVAKREEIEEEGRSYEEDLEDLFTEFANSRAILPRFRSEAKEIEREHGKPLEDIEADLKELAENSEYDIDEDRWTDRMGDGLA